MDTEMSTSTMTEASNVSTVLAVTNTIPVDSPQDMPRPRA